MLGIMGLLGLTACTEPEPSGEPQTAAEVIDLELGAADRVDDCGEVNIDLDACGDKPPAAAQAMIDCILDHWESCTPARAVMYLPTIEGYSNPDTWGVVKDDEGSCSLVLFTDWTADPYGGCKLLRRECGGYDEGDVSSCPWLFPGTCGQSQEVFAVEECGEQ